MVRPQGWDLKAPEQGEPDEPHKRRKGSHIGRVLKLKAPEHVLTKGEPQDYNGYGQC